MINGKSQNLPNYSMRAIYNRWGKLIFSKEGYTNEWDISDVSDGIYFFQLKRKNTLGEYKGWVQVIGSMKYE